MKSTKKWMMNSNWTNFWNFSVGAAHVQGNPCEGKETGEIPEYDCKSFTMCFGEDPRHFECPEGLVFNVEVGNCDM